MNLSAAFRRPAVRSRLILFFILLGAFALRLWGLDQHNIWWDEGFTVWMTRLPVPQLLDRTAHDTHPPLSYLMQRGWWLLTGDGEWQMRFVSVFAGTLAVAVVDSIARRLGGRRTRLLSAAFVAVSVFAITWSQEIRMYAWVSAWGLLALYAALRVWQSSRPGWFILYVGATAAALLSLYLSAVIPVVANLAFGVYWWRSGRSLKTLVRWALAQLSVLALLAPWLAYALPRMPHWSAAESYSAGFFLRLYATVLATGVGENIDAWLLPAILVLAFALAGVVALVRLRKSPLQTGGLALLVFAVLLPPALVYGLTALPGSPYVPPLSPRYFLPLAAAFSVLLGWGLAQMSRRARTGTLGMLGAQLVLAVALSSVLALLPGRVATDQYVSLVDTLRAHEHPGDEVLLYPDEDWPLFAARYPGTWEKVPAGMDLTAENVPGLLQPVWEAAEGLWVVTTPKAQETDRQGLVQGWLQSHAAARTDWDFGETRLTLYARTAERAGTLRDVAGGLPRFTGVAEVAGARMGAVGLPLRRYRTGDTLYATVYWLDPATRILKLGMREAVAPQELLPAPLPVTAGPQRIVGRLPLTPDLRPGTYHVVLRDQGREVAELGTIELAAAARSQAATIKPQRPLDVRLGEHVRLLGYDLADQPVQPGEFVSLTLYWQADAVLTDRYKVFTHLIGTVWNADEGNFLWGQQDSEPQADQLPTTRWAPGEVIVDRYRIKLSPKAPAGSYQVEVGMYGLIDGTRLRFQDGGDALVLGQVQAQ